MKGLTSLFLGIFGTFAFSWVGLTVIPNWQIGRLNPQSDEEGTDIYPQPQSGMVERGVHVYAANGCIYCHSQQVRADYAANDIERKWGDRRSAPRDYIFERPVFLGKMRMGQDIANIGVRAPKEQETPAQGAAVSSPPAPATSPASASPASQGGAPTAASPAAKQTSSPSPSTQAGSPVPAGSPSSAASPAAKGAAVASPPPAASPSPAVGAPWPVQTAGEPPMYSAAWHHVHLYSPRSINIDSNMPSYRFLYEKRRISAARSADALQLSGSDAPPEGWEIVPTFDAKCLVAYLIALNQSHPLNEVKSVGGAPAAPAPAAGSPAPSSPAPKK
jgi:cytochrome c oxidase cbb3-type subunit 2